jgi:hypothetical protein
MTIAILTMATVLSVATPTAVYRPSYSQLQPTAHAELAVRVTTLNGRGQILRAPTPEAAVAKTPLKPCRRLSAVGR